MLKNLLDKNKVWAAEIVNKDPDFFTTLAKGQKPAYLWIGCSDSRVPANQITGMLPGEVFVHRNIANLIQTNDTNCLSVVQFAVEALKVKHIIVCGHYGCGGVNAAIENTANGVLDRWIGNIKLTTKKHEKLLAKVPTEKLNDVVCELNVIEQIMTLSQSQTIQDAWKSNADLAIHGLMYDINDGILKDLDINCSEDDSIQEVYQTTVEKIKQAYT